MRRPGAVVVVGLGVVVAGCDRSYIVDNATWSRVQAIPARERGAQAFPAARVDGTNVVLRADSVMELAGEAGPERSLVRAHRGRAMAAVGVALGSLGALLVAGGIPLAVGANSPRADEGSGGILGISLIAAGLGHLIPGLLLTVAGARDGPELERSPGAVGASAPP